MATKIGIINLALAKLGETRIASLSDNTKASRLADSIFDDVRRAELRSHPWNFAMSRASIPALVDAPAFGFAYQYQLPADFLRIVQVNDGPLVNMSDLRGTNQTDYQIEGGKILTDDAAPLELRYIADVENTAVYDALFVQALACRLALEMCEDITQSNTKKEALREDYKLVVREARKVDAMENPVTYPADDAWMASRC